jgi:hypothetical protein
VVVAFEVFSVFGWRGVERLVWEERERERRGWGLINSLVFMQ